MSDDVARGVRDHYSVSAQTYTNHYDPDNLYSSPTYPAEYFRLRNLLARLKAQQAKRVLDAGCGEGTPLVEIAKLGCDVRGFDFTPEMIEAAVANFKANGMDPAYLMEADVQDFDSYAPLLGDEPFDAAVCFGVMPHVESEQVSLKNLHRVLATGGRAYVEFRNALFNLVTMNRFTQGYLAGEIFAGAPEPIRKATGDYLATVLAMDKPPLRTEAEAGKPGYDAIQARMHNPLTIGDLFAEAGFADPVIHWYHFHPTLPLLEGNGVDPVAFRKAAIEMEGNPQDWRGHFLCSAFVVEAVAA